MNHKKLDLYKRWLVSGLLISGLPLLDQFYASLVGILQQAMFIRQEGYAEVTVSESKLH